MTGTVTIPQLPAGSTIPAGGLLHGFDPNLAVGTRDIGMPMSAFQPTFIAQAVNVVFAGPASGGSGLPAFRALVLADMPAGIGLTANPLSQFAATTSAQLAGVISDETGSGALVFANSPTFTGTVNVAGITASGAISGFPGRQLGVQVFAASGTYTPTAGTGSIVVEVLAGGGAGGGAPTTAAGQISVGAGGQAGGYAKGRITSGFSGATVTVGAGGTGVVGAAGNSGGVSSFGAVISCPGGTGGSFAGTQTAATLAIPQGPAAVPTGGSILNTSGMLGQLGIAVSATLGIGGIGGSSPYGGGGYLGLNNTGGAATGKGAGGGGGEIGASSAGVAGGAGSGGLVIVWEYQ